MKVLGAYENSFVGEVWEWQWGKSLIEKFLKWGVVVKSEYIKLFAGIGYKEEQRNGAVTGGESGNKKRLFNDEEITCLYIVEIIR